MAESGLLTEVKWEWDGTTVLTAASIGATGLSVDDILSIAEDDSVWVGGDVSPYTITAYDADLSTITISPGLVTAVEEGDPVVPDVGGQAGRVWVAVVLLPDADEPIEVPLVASDLLIMPEGVFNPPVSISLADDLSSVLDLPGQQPVIDGTLIPPDTLPTGSDGFLPPPSVTPTVVGLARQLIAHIPGVVNNDPVEYEWHIDTTTTVPALGDATTHHTSASTLATFATLADQVTDLVYDIPYYIGVFAIDADGAAPFSGWSLPSLMDPNGTADIAVGSILAANIDVVNLLANGLRTADAGQRVTISTAEGIAVYDSAENIRLSAPTNGNDFQLNMDAILQSATIYKMALQGLLNVFAKQSVVTLESSIQASLSPPAATVLWPATTLALDATFRPFDQRRGSYFYTGNVWVGYRFIGGGFLTEFNPATGALTGGQFNLPSGMQPDGGIVHMVIAGNQRWVALCKKDSDNTWWVVIMNDSGVFQSQWQWTSGSTTKGAAISTDGATVLIAQRTTGAVYRVWSHAASLGTVLSTTDCTATLGAVINSEVNGLYYGSADYGATRIAISLKDDEQIRVFNSSGVEQSNVRFNIANGERVAGLAWDGTNFWTSSRDTSALYKYSDLFKNTALLLVWPAYTWKDTDATGGTHETSMSPQISKTLQRRQSITVTTPDIPDAGGTDDPDSVGLYLGYKATLPARTEMWLHTTPASGVRTATIVAQVGSGTNPPVAPGNFPAAIPARVNASDGTGLLAGDQSFPIEETYTPVWTAAGGTPNVGTTGTIVGSWHRHGERIHVEIVMTFNGTGINAGTGVWSWSLPPGLNARYAAARCFGSGIIDDASGSKTGGYSVGAASSTTVGMWSSAGRVSAAAPQAPAAGDIYMLQFDYFKV